MLLVVLAAAPFVLAQDQREPTFPAPAVGVSSAGLRQTLANYWQWRLANQPELSTRVGNAEHNDRWTDWSKGAREGRRAARQEFLQQVLYVGTGNLTAAEHLNAELLEYELRSALDVEPWADLIERASQADGLHNEVFNVVDQMPARTVRDYENVIARLRALPAYIDQSIALLREQLASGFAQPADAIDLMIDQVVAQGNATPDESPLLAAFRSFPREVAPDDQTRLRADARRAFAEQFVPSWKRLEVFLRDTYLTVSRTARPGPGLSSMPNGDRAYATLIRYFTTTRLDARAIHQLGLAEVARIQGEMEKLAREAGFAGSAGDVERKLHDDRGLRFSSQAEMLDHARDLLARVEPQIPRLFAKVPRATVGVRPIPPDREESTASNYSAGTGDGTRQAWFNMNTHQPTLQSKYTIDALVLHETVPGHHLQVGLARELEGLPAFRTVLRAGAFSEGWALYAESLGAELGAYREPVSRFGQLASEQFRAVRLVVDTGIHAMGWSREQARKYFVEHVPAQSLAEVDRYIARPGQALSYKLGELKVRELRRKAEQALGSRFDIREFHDAVLRNGAVPLDVLESQIDAYIRTAQARRVN